MNKIYLLVFLPTATAKEQKLDREKITTWLDGQSWCAHWFYQLPNSIFVKSTIDAEQMSKAFEAAFGVRRHIFVRVSGDYYGRLPKDHWDFFK